jgi:two-component system sensor histidine kinase RegB
MDRIGDPYVTSSRRRRMNVDGVSGGLGLGFFIAKTLLERSGATLTFENRAAPERGAVVRVRWSRSDFGQKLASLS